MINIYTDGASKGNPGKGGYGVILESGQHYKELAQGYQNTTNNRMELLAVIVGLEAIKAPNQQIVVYSDSQYVVNSVEKGWLKSWLKTDFKGKKNRDLWLRFWTIYQKHQVKFIWIKGHNGHPMNERCDTLAVNASQSSMLKEDKGYINQT